MYRLAANWFDCELKQVAREASRALARLDADRLEELVRSCEMFKVAPLGCAEKATQVREAISEIAMFARVLDATRANLEVIRRLRDLRRGQASYGDRAARRGLVSEAVNGDD